MPYRVCGLIRNYTIYGQLSIDCQNKPISSWNALG